MYSKRTDLALDMAKELKTANSSGYSQSVYDLYETEITKIDIEDERGAKAFSKPVGTYITATLSKRWYIDNDEGMRCAKALSEELLNLLPKDGTVLVVGLGNIGITADAIGPLAIQKIIATRHLKEQLPNEFSGLHSVCALAPGVLSMTGIETGEIVYGVCKNIAPAAIIAIDALATSDNARLCNTFQLTNTGITPGSGVGNPRFAFNFDSFGVPVLAIGVPTVVSALDLLPHRDADDDISELSQLIVTPKDIDLLSEKSAHIIAAAVNLALHENMSAEELSEFVI